MCKFTGAEKAGSTEMRKREQFYQRDISMLVVHDEGFCRGYEGLPVIQRSFRVVHHKSDGKRPAFVLQNRVVHAESAESALRAAMRGRAAMLPIDVRSDVLALVNFVSSNNLLDYWIAELELG